MSLTGRRILVTRRAAQAASMKEEIERRGGSAILLPLLDIAPPHSWDACDHAIEQLAMYDAVVFTSSNAVLGLTGRMTALGKNPDVLATKRVFAVGTATEQTVRRQGLVPEQVPARASARALAAAILREEDIAGGRFLFPCGDLARDELPGALAAAGAVCDRIEVYRTVAADVPEAGTIMNELSDRRIDVVTFASPSAVEVFTRVFPDMPLSALRRFAHIAVIGPTTASAVRDAGAEPDIVARTSTAEGLIQTIEEYYQKHHE